MKNPFIRQILSYLLNGLLLALPIYVTCYVLYTVFNTLDGIIPIKHKFPGLGIIILVILLMVVGYMGSKVINEQIKQILMKFLDRIPFIKTIYKSVTDMLGAFVGNKKRFNKPVLVKLSKETDVEVVGFITDEDLQEVGNPEGKIGVYLPMSYSFSGHLVIVPKANVKLLETNSLDLMKYVVSGGVVEIEVEEKDNNEQK